MNTAAAEPLGLIAGNGQFPILFARAAQARGIPVVAVGMQGETEPAVAALVHSMTWVRVGQLAPMIRAFRRAGVRRAAMAGGVQKTRLFGTARPDWLAFWVLARCVIRRDDGMLRAVAAQFEKAGIRIVESTLYMPEALAPAGVLTQASPNKRQWHDLRYGLGVARTIGTLDIGQTVVIKDGAVVALEAIEGTDACIQRAGDLTRRSGAVVVKVAKPAQDMRFDVPAIGPKTLDSLVAAGVQVLGIEAGRTLMLEPTRLIEQANRRGLVVVGLTDSDCAGAPS